MQQFFRGMENLNMRLHFLYLHAGVTQNFEHAIEKFRQINEHVDFWHRVEAD